MPRMARAAVRDYCYRSIDRGHGCAVVFWLEDQMREWPRSQASMRVSSPSFARRN